MNRSKPGRNIRAGGEDVGEGDRVLGIGNALGPAEIGLIASLGHPSVEVYRVLALAIMSTGSELVGRGSTIGPGPNP